MLIPYSRTSLKDIALKAGVPFPNQKISSLRLIPFKSCCINEMYIDITGKYNIIEYLYPRDTIRSVPNFAWLDDTHYVEGLFYDKDGNLRYALKNGTFGY